MATFIEACLSGTASPGDVDDFVDRWHAGEGNGLTLREYLGMTLDEYGAWMMDAEAIDAILAARKMQGAAPQI